MALTKRVFDISLGQAVDVPLTAQEETDMRAAWAAADAASAQAALTDYLNQRNLVLGSEAGQLMTLLFNDIAAGTALNAGTFYAAVKAVNDKYPPPKA